MKGNLLSRFSEELDRLVLQFFAARPGGLFGLSTVQEHTGIPKRTLQRVLSGLATAKTLEVVRRKYRLADQDLLQVGVKVGQCCGVCATTKYSISEQNVSHHLGTDASAGIDESCSSTAALPSAVAPGTRLPRAGAGPFDSGMLQPADVATAYLQVVEGAREQQATWNKVAGIIRSNKRQSGCLSDDDRKAVRRQDRSRRKRLEELRLDVLRAVVHKWWDQDGAGLIARIREEVPDWKERLRDASTETRVRPARTLPRPVCGRSAELEPSSARVAVLCAFDDSGFTLPMLYGRFPGVSKGTLRSLVARMANDQQLVRMSRGKYALPPPAAPAAAAEADPFSGSGFEAEWVAWESHSDEEAE